AALGYGESPPPARSLRRLTLAELLDDLVDGARHVEVLLRDLVVLAFDDFLEPADGVGDGHVLALEAGELLRDEERLREEPLDLARPRDGQLVVFGELVDAENRDDVLQILVALQNLFDRTRHAVVFVAENAWIENPGRRGERVDGRVDTELGDLPRQVGRRVEVREGR